MFEYCDKWLVLVLFYLCCFAKGWESIDWTWGNPWEEVDFTQHFSIFLCFPKELPTIALWTLKSSNSSLSLVHLQSIDVGQSSGEDWAQLQLCQVQWSGIVKTLVKHWCLPIIGRRLSSNLRPRLCWIEIQARSNQDRGHFLALYLARRANFRGS